MSPKRSAGVLAHRSRAGGLEVFIAHMGGPFWSRKDARAWTIPKGEYEPGEDPLSAARREFEEEIGVAAPIGDYVFLGEARQGGGKVVSAWAVQADFELAQVTSNTFSIEWPRGSGRIQEFPEVDRAVWFSVEDAKEKLVAAQSGFVDLLVASLGSGERTGDDDSS